MAIICSINLSSKRKKREIKKGKRDEKKGKVEGEKEGMKEEWEEDKKLLNRHNKLGAVQGSFHILFHLNFMM